MAEHVAIPAGVNPATAGGGPDVTTYGSRGKEGLAVPPVAEQREGFTPPPVAPAAPAGVDEAQFAAFKAWQEQQAKERAAAPAAPVVPPVASPVAEGEGIGGEAALEAVRNAGDALVNNTFEMFELLAPGLDLNRALGNAIDRADLSLLDRAYLREKGGDKADKLIKLAENMVNHVNTQVVALVNDLHSQAGGEAQWNAAAAAFNKDAPKHIKQWAVDMLNSANPAKIKAAGAAIVDFAKQSGTVVVPPQGHVRAGGGTPNAQLGLSKADYQAARLKLDRFDRNYENAARELDARRMIGKQLGL